jgi:putative zinc finger protein
MTTGEARADVCTAGAPSPFPLHRLSAFLDGDLPAAELQSVRQHLEGCAACARQAAELGAVARAARALEAPEPPPTLWPSIEGALEGPTPWWLSWRPFGVGVLAGAAAAAALVLGGGAWRAAVTREAASVVAAAPASQAQQAPQAPQAPIDPLLVEAEQEFARAAAVYERSIEKLRGLLAREEGQWPAEMRARTDERLARLDDAIARSREAARRAPGDSEGNEQLFAAYQQKLAFLTETVQRGGGWGQGAP